MFAKPGLFYSNNPSTVFNNKWLLDANKINGLKKHKLSIIDFSSEHYGSNGIDYIHHALADADVNFLLLSHEPADHKKFDRMLFYPHWYYWAIKNFIGKPNQSVDRNYKWSCLNGAPRVHRIYNYFYSKQQSYFDSACFTFFYHDNVSRPDDITLPNEALDFWTNIKDTLPSREVLKNGPRSDSRCDLPANTDAYIHLITETTVLPRIFVSEKTWKPVASGQLFLIFGNPGTVKHLRNIGVDVFDDIIDHSYDGLENWQDRLHAIHEQLNYLVNKNLRDIYIETQNRRNNNVNKFFAGAFDSQYKQTILQCINMLS